MAFAIPLAFGLMGTVIGAGLGAALGISGLAGIGFAVGGFIGRLISPPTIAKTPGSPNYVSDQPITMSSSGIAKTTMSADTYVPIMIGQVMVAGNFVQGYNLGEANSRLLGFLALGEYIGNPDPSLLDLYVDGLKFQNLSNYSGVRDDDKSWFEFYPNGGPATITVKNTGKKGIGVQLNNTEEHTSYGIDFPGGGTAVISLNHFVPKYGSTQSIVISWKLEGQEDFTTAITTANYWVKVTVYQVPTPGGGVDTIYEYYEGYTRQTYTISDLPDGVIYFKVEAVSIDNDGHILWEYVNVDSSGSDVTFHYPYTAGLLVNVVKTDEISAANFSAILSCSLSNPAKAIRFFMADPELGLGMGQEIDEESFALAEAWCDNHGKSIGAVFTGSSYDQVIEFIALCGCLIRTKTGGTYKLIPNEDSAPVKSFDISQNVIQGSFEWGMVDYYNTCNRLKAMYVDSDDMYAKVPLIVEDAAQIDVDGWIREQTVDLSGIIFMSAVQLRAEELFKQINMANVWCKFAVGIKDTRLEPGDVFQVVHDDIDWTAAADKRFRCLSIDEIDDEHGKYGYNVYAVLHVPESYVHDYDWHDWHPAAVSVPEFQDDLQRVPIDEIALETVFLDGTIWKARLKITYTNPDDSNYSAVNLWGRPVYASGWMLLATLDNSEEIYYDVVELYIHWEFILEVVGVDGSKAGGPTDAYKLITLYYPTASPYWSPGWGGGRWGDQPWGI